MARRLTIRTKLVAGLVLVLAISAVLTTNTLIGLYSYRNSIRAFGSKTRELPLGGELWDRVAQLDYPSASSQFQPPGGVGIDFDARIGLVEKALDDYRSRLLRNLERGRDPDQGKTELSLLERIEHQVERIRQLPPYSYWEDDEQWLLDLAMRDQLLVRRAEFRQHVAALSSLVGSLPEPTSADMAALAEEARATYSANLWIAWCTSVLVVALLLLVSRLSYHWIFRPIHQLLGSVRRVGKEICRIACSSIRTMRCRSWPRRLTR